MRNNHLNITYAYHFFSEAIIIFLIVLPILHYHYFWVPYWSYLLVTLLACALFSIITRLKTGYIWYLGMAPVFFITFSVLDYPLFMTILFSGLFVWRYIDIRREEIISRENNYILFTLILTAFVMLLVHYGHVMLYPFFQFIVLVFGYIVSNLAVVKQAERKQFDKKLAVYFVGLLALGAGVFYLLFAYARRTALMIWDGILLLITGSLNGLGKLLSLFTIEKREWSDQKSSPGEDDFEYWNKLEEFNVVDTVTNYWVIAVSLLLFSIVLFFVLFLWKKRFHGTIDRLDTEDESVSYQNIDQTDKERNRSILAGFKKYFHKPKHPVRKMVYQFEQEAAKTKKGRKYSETVEDWLHRTGWEVDLEIYQKVRYGQQDVSNRDVEHLKAQLKEIESQL